MLPHDNEYQNLEQESACHQPAHGHMISSHDKVATLQNTHKNKG